MNYCNTILLFIIFLIFYIKNNKVEHFKSLPTELNSTKICKRYFKKINLINYNSDQHINYSLTKIFIPNLTSKILEYNVNLGLFSYYNYISESLHKFRNIYLKTNNKEIYKSLKIKYRQVRDEYLPKDIMGVIGLSLFKKLHIKTNK